MPESIGRGGGIRTRDPLHPMQVRYQAALRPDKPKIISYFGKVRLISENFDDISQLLADRLKGNPFVLFALFQRIFQTVSGTTDGETLIVQELPNASYQEYFMVLVIAPVSPSLYGLELGELLFPVSENVRLDPAEFADFSNSEIALGRNRRQRLFWRVFRLVFHYRKAPLRPLVSGWHGRLRRAVP